MSTKNLPLTTYITSKIYLKTSVLQQIRVIKQTKLEKQLEIYKLELEVEFLKAIENFRLNQETTEENLNELKITEELFIENLNKLNEEKLSIYASELYNTLELEMAKLKPLLLSEILKLFRYEINFNLLYESFFKLFKEYRGGDSIIDGKVSKNFPHLTNILSHLNINSSVDPKLILFLDRTGYSLFKSFKKSKKVKFRKYKMKRKKVRKLYVFRKLKRIVIFRKIKKKYYTQKSFNLSFLNYFKSISKETLTKRIPVSIRIVESTSVEFFYKLNKKKNWNLIEDFNQADSYNEDFLIYLRNYHQKPYHKFRKARITHWSFFFNKTLRKQRYKGFINKYLKKYNKISYSLSFFMNFFTKMKFSWTRMDKLESFFKLYIVEYSNSIVRIPMIFANFFKWNLLKRRNFILRKKMGRWSYLNFRRATCPWLQRKKNTPKINKHIQPNFYQFSAISYWDFMSGFLYLSENLKSHAIPPVNQFKTNLLIKLHMYRYKANKKCMLL